MNCFSILLGALLAVSRSNALTTSTPSGAGSPRQLQQGSSEFLGGWICLSSLRHLIQVSYQELNQYPEGQSRCVATGLLIPLCLLLLYALITSYPYLLLSSGFANGFRRHFLIYWGVAKLVRHQTLTLARPCRPLVRAQPPQPPAD